VHQVAAKLAQVGDQLAIGQPISPGVDFSAEGVEDDEAVAARPGAGHQFALRAEGRAGNQRDIVPAGAQALASEERVLLSPAQDQPGDHVADSSHDAIVPGGGPAVKLRVEFRAVGFDRAYPAA